MPVAKNNHQIILRAADASDKYEWLARLRNATEPGAGVGRAPRISGTSAQYAAGAKGGPGGPGGGGEGGEGQGLFGRAVDRMQKFTGWGGSKLGNVTEVRGGGCRGERRRGRGQAGRKPRSASMPDP